LFAILTTNITSEGYHATLLTVQIYTFTFQSFQRNRYLLKRSAITSRLTKLLVTTLFVNDLIYM